MKTLLTFVLLTAGCAGIPTELPFKEYIEPDGTRTWSIDFRDEWRQHYAGQSNEDLIAQQMAWSRLCENGYTIDRSEITDDGRTYYGTCR